jgi:hypothetical protein
MGMDDDGGGGALDNDNGEDNNGGPRGGGPLLIDEKVGQVGGVTGVNDDRMGCTTTSASTSAYATTAPGLSKNLCICFLTSSYLGFFCKRIA